ncbi:MAG: hypothetical protein WCF90_10950, partial [Methanomicrobiales archaeon]
GKNQRLKYGCQRTIKCKEPEQPAFKAAADIHANQKNPAHVSVKLPKSKKQSSFFCRKRSKLLGISQQSIDSGCPPFLLIVIAAVMVSRWDATGFCDRGGQRP